MTTPKSTTSPAVKRALEAQARLGWKSTTSAEATLGDAIIADRMPAKALWQSVVAELSDLSPADTEGVFDDFSDLDEEDYS